MLETWRRNENTQSTRALCLSLCVFVCMCYWAKYIMTAAKTSCRSTSPHLRLSPFIKCRILASWPGQKLSSFALKWSSTAKHSQANAQRGETQRERSRASPHTAVRPYITKAMCVAAVACLPARLPCSAPTHLALILLGFFIFVVCWFRGTKVKFI